MNFQNALARFAEYQAANNSPKYALASVRRVVPFLKRCEELGVTELGNVTQQHIQAFLSSIPKTEKPGAWRSHYIAIQVFFNYCVFFGLIASVSNPMNQTPNAESLTNKPLLTHTDFQRLLLVFPDNHQGFQDRLCCLLLWSGVRLGRLSGLKLSDVPTLPAPARQLAERLTKNRGHAMTSAVFVTTRGQTQTIHGQKLNRRLQKYAETAGCSTPKRISAGLLHQSGAYDRFAATKGAMK